MTVLDNAAKRVPAASLLQRIVASAEDCEAGDVAAAMPFAIIRREEADEVDIFTGTIVDVDSLAAIPLRTGEGSPDVLAMVPFQTITERGFAAHRDDTPLRCMILTEREHMSLADVMATLPNRSIPVTASGFDIGDEEYADIVQGVIRDEIKTGQGANFVIHRAYKASTETAPALAALVWLRALLEKERGSYWTFAVHTTDQTAVGATPERHVSARSRVVTMNPISGTFRHPETGPTVADIRTFLDDVKESEELFMVVDEEMKMMSAICPEGGRIRGPFLKHMSRLTHTEFVIEGESDLDVRDILRATMFAPTVTGSPMENACEVITRHEKTTRGYYSGVLALFEFVDGTYTLDAPILIRTAFIKGDGTVTVPVGATIMRKSTPRGETEETRAKAAGVLTALGLSGSSTPTSGSPLGADPSIDQALQRRQALVAPYWAEQQLRRAQRHESRTALLINFGDQFTEMLAHQLRGLGFDVTVTAWDDVAGVLTEDLVVFGPGPGDPTRREEPRISRMRELLRERLHSARPLMAVCLSHQVLADLAGLEVRLLAVPRQGERLNVDVFGQAATLGYYNSFAARTQDTNNLGLTIDAEPTGVVTAMRGPGVVSIQGHMESILATDGVATLERLVEMVFQ